MRQKETKRKIKGKRATSFTPIVDLFGIEKEMKEIKILKKQTQKGYIVLKLLV